MPFSSIQSSSGSIPFVPPPTTYTCQGWELSSATPLDTQTFFSTAVEAGQYLDGIYIKSDGSGFYLIDSFTPVTMWQYDTPVPWDFQLSVATGSKNVGTPAGLYTGTSNGTAQRPWFSSDGTRLYFVGRQAVSTWFVYEFTLSTPWNITTAAYSTQFSAAAQTDTARGVTFDTTGTYMYIAGYKSSGSQSLIVKYTLSTPWVLSTASYSGDQLDVSAQTGAGVSRVSFIPDGTKMYVFQTEGTAPNWAKIFQFVLGTPWVVSTATYTGGFQDWSITNDRIDMEDIFVKDNNTIFIMDAYQRKIWETTMVGEDLSTLDLTDTSYWLGSTGTFPCASKFSADGLHLIVSTRGIPNALHSFTLTVPWDLTTITPQATVTTSTLGIPTAWHFTFSPNGTKLYTVASSGTFKYVYSLTMSTPWDVSTLTYDGAAARYNHPFIFRSTSVALSPDGTKMFLTGDGGSGAITAYSFDLGTPWVINTAVQTNSTAVLGINIVFRNDGKRFFVHNSHTVYQYTLDTPWVLDFDDNYDRVRRTLYRHDLNAVLGDVGGVNDVKLFICGQTSSRLYELNLESCWANDHEGWDVVPIYKLNKSLFVGGQDTSVNDVEFSADGTNVYIVGSSTDTAYQYSLATAWDISTATYTGKTLSFVPQSETVPSGIAFKPDGTKLYMVGSGTDNVRQYGMTVPWDLSSASYDNLAFSVSGQETTPSGITFKPDGTKMYIVGTASDRVRQYTLNTPWDISTAVFDNISSISLSTLPLLSNESLPTGVISSWETNSSGVHFKPDGTKMYVSGTNTDRIFQFTLSTPWSVDTAVYDNKVASVQREDESTVTGFRIDPTGEFVYVSGSTSDSVYQYSLIPPV